MTLPWLPFFLAAIWKLIKETFQRKNAKTQEEIQTEIDRINRSKNPFLPFSLSPLLLFSFAWLLVPLMFFSFSGSKLPGYILPALPAALILTADYVSRFAEKSKMRERALRGIAAGTLVLIFVILQFIIDDFARRDTVKYLVAEANARGYANSKILTLHNITHNMEFYGAGRLVRTANGKIRQFFGVEEIAEEMRRQNDKTVLVLVPLEYANQLTERASVSTEKLGDNGEFAIFAVNLKGVEKDEGK